ncbi:MAG: restriction endonuclease [Bacteroidia bacterium]
MEKLSAANLVRFIAQLPKGQAFNYITTSTHTVVTIDTIEGPEGPIKIHRWDPTKGGKPNNTVSISKEMLWRIANAILPNQPVNFDRVLGASYNTRSALESLLAYTPQFYYCHPKRIEIISDTSSIKEGHKHLIWMPEKPHKNGILQEFETDVVISELPIQVQYDSLQLPTGLDTSGVSVDVQRRHAQMQIALIEIGQQLNFRTWVAANDKSIMYNQKRIGEMPSVVPDLRKEKMLLAYADAAKAANLIDCIWFKNGTLMPAVMEIEHSTGVTSGLDRMKNFKGLFPPFPTRYVIVAPDEIRNKVVQEANKPHYKDMNTRFFAYSAVDELYYLCKKRSLKGVTEEFLDCFMEPVVMN